MFSLQNTTDNGYWLCLNLDSTYDIVPEGGQQIPVAAPVDCGDPIFMVSFFCPLGPADSCIYWASNI